MSIWLEISGSLHELIHRIPWVWPAAILLVAALLGWLVLRRGRIVVPETQVAVICNLDTHDLSRFLPPGTHRINPGVEQVRTTISTQPRNARGCAVAQTRDEHPVTLEWQLTYRFEPLLVDPHLSVDEICAIVRKAEHRIPQLTNESVQELLKHYSLADLWEIGIQNQVKRQFTRLASDQLHPFGVLIEWVDIENIQAAPELEAKKFARFVRSIRVNKGDLSRAELGQLAQSTEDHPSGAVRQARTSQADPEPRKTPRDRSPSPGTQYQDSLAHTTIYDIELPSDGSIGKMVV